MAEISDKEIKALQKSVGVLSSNITNLIKQVKPEEKPKAKLETKTLGGELKKKEEQTFTAKEGGKLLDIVSNLDKKTKQGKDEQSKSLKTELKDTKKAIKTIVEDGNEQLIKQIKELKKQIVEDKKAFSEINANNEQKLNEYIAHTAKVFSKLSMNTDLIKKSTTSNVQSKKLDQSITLAKKSISLLKSVVTISKDVQTTVNNIKKQTQLLVSKLISTKKVVKQVKGVDKEKNVKKLSFNDSLDEILQTVKQSLSFIVLGEKNKRTANITEYHLKSVHEKLDDIAEKGVKVIKKAPEINKEKLLQEKLNEINRNTRSTNKNVKETKKLVSRVDYAVPKIQKGEHDLLEFMQEAEEQRQIEAQRQKELNALLGKTAKHEATTTKKEDKKETKKTGSSWLMDLLKLLGFGYLIFDFLMKNKDKILPLVKDAFKKLFDLIPWAEVFKFVGKSLVVIGELVMAALSGIFKSLWTSIKYSKLGKAIRGFFGDIAQWIKDSWLGKMWKVVSDFFVEKFSGPIAAIKEFIKPLTDFAGNIFGTVWEHITGFFKTAAYATLGLLAVSYFIPVFGGMIRKYLIGAPFKFLLKSILFPVIATVAKGIWGTVSKMFVKDAAVAATTATTATTTAASSAPGFFSKIGSKISSAASSVKDVAATGWDKTKGAAVWAGKGIASGAEKVYDIAADKLSILKQGKDWLGSKIGSIGSKIGGLLKMIKEKGPALIGKVGGTKGKLIAFLMSLLISGGLSASQIDYTGSKRSLVLQALPALLGVTTGAGLGTILGSLGLLGGPMSMVLGAAGGFAGDYIGSWLGEQIAPSVADMMGYTPEQEAQELAERKKKLEQETNKSNIPTVPIPDMKKDVEKTPIPTNQSIENAQEQVTSFEDTLSKMGLVSFTPEMGAFDENGEVKLDAKQQATLTSLYQKAEQDQQQQLTNSYDEEQNQYSPVDTIDMGNLNQDYKPNTKLNDIEGEMEKIKEQIFDNQTELLKMIQDLGNGVIATNDTVVKVGNRNINAINDVKSIVYREKPIDVRNGA